MNSQFKDMNNKVILALVFAFLLCKSTFAQDRGFVQEEVIKVAGITDDSQIYNLSPSQKQTMRYYQDNLGRTIQTISMKASPLQNDIIQINKYDNLGRQTYALLPYASSDGNGGFKPAANTDQLAFYSNGLGDKVADDTSPFSQAVFENSPIQRLLQAGSVGNGFQPGQHYKTESYRQNTLADGVISWSPAGINTGSYAVGSLSATAIIDEAGVQSIEFKDINGRLILKRQLINEVINGVTETYLDTYYIYNERGAIAWVVPPKAFAIMKAGANWSLTQTGVVDLLYSYLYDSRARLVEKKIPGAGVIYIVYDPLNRPVLVQDGNLRSANKWNYIKYDLKNRAISQGIYVDATYTSRSAMQNYVNSLNYSTTYFEKRGTASATGYYSNSVFPTTNTTPLAYSYYDDYDLNKDGSPDYSYQSQGLSSEETATGYTRGMLTAVSKRSIGTGLADIWLTNVVFYNKNGRVIQTRSNNQLNATVGDSRTNVLDFIGRPVQVKTIKVTSASTTILSSFGYDHASRLKTIDDSYNGATSIRIASYEYNELGQLVDKKLHSTNGGASYIQSVDFRYNIKGALTSINNSTLTADSKNDDTNDVFGMEILYDQKDNALNNTPYYNGLVSAVKWKAITPVSPSPSQRGYRFDYDTRNQLKNALYSTSPSGSGTWTNDGAFDEKNLSYDHNGNIMSLKRNTLLAGVVTEVDNLSYSYMGNQMSNVTDGTGGSYAAVGFKNVTGSTSSYVYDVNGNMTTDPKKGLSLTYNVLNRTDKITITTATGRYITYTYDATGVLLRKQTYDNSTLQKTTDYIDGFVYENNALVYFGMAEGRVRNTGTALKPEYMIADQQGNVRVSFEESSGVAVVRQENSYYPFGLIMPGGYTPTMPNKNLYNGGSEWQNDFSDMPDLYSTFYRNYDPALGRFVSVDPKAEASISLTTYNYVGNNPILFSDPLGDTKLSQATLAMLSFIFNATGKFGGEWSASSGVTNYTSDKGAFDSTVAILGIGSFGQNGLPSYSSAANAFNQSNHTGGDVPTEWRELAGVTVQSGNMASYLAAHVEIQKQMDSFNTSGESIWSTIWNSPVARYIVPDVIGLNVGFTNVLGIGYGGNSQILVLTRGKDAGIHATYGFSGRVGVDVGVSATAFSGYYLGDARNATYGSLLGTGADLSGSFAGVTGGGWSSLNSNFTPTWIGTDIGIAAGPPVGPKFGISGGVSITQPIF